MTPQQESAMRQALEACQTLVTLPGSVNWIKTLRLAVEQSREAITALTAALEQPAQEEPVEAAWQQGYDQGVADERTSEANIGIAGFGAKVNPARVNPYTRPQAREWVGLTDEEMQDIEAETWGAAFLRPQSARQYASAIEAKLREKNLWA